MMRPIASNMSKIRVTIWNENIHERQEGAWADLIRSFYPAGIHNALAESGQIPINHARWN